LGGHDEIVCVYNHELIVVRKKKKKKIKLGSKKELEIQWGRKGGRGYVVCIGETRDMLEVIIERRSIDVIIY
jgi:hypothetical protein